MSIATDTDQTLIDPAEFAGKIHIDGEWVVGGGRRDRRRSSPRPARRSRWSGSPAPPTSRAPPKVRRRAQKEWAALPHPARAAVLRRAGQLWEEHAEEIMGWNIREVGAIPPLAGFALHVTAAECYEASALPSAPLGTILSSEEPRLSLAQRTRWASSGSSPRSTCR